VVAVSLITKNTPNVVRLRPQELGKQGQTVANDAR